jgi:hypothetical protein
MSTRGRRLSDDRGTAATILLFPVFAIVTFMFIQALWWQHDRQLASSVADRTSSAVALYGAAPGDAQGDATTELTSAGMRNVSVSVTRGAEVTVVEVSGDAPGILVGTSVRVTARSVTPTEQFEAP